MMALANKLGWLSPADEQREFIRMIADRMAKDAVGPAEVDLVCGRVKERRDSDAGLPLSATAARTRNVANAAVLACLGSTEGRAVVVGALSGGNDADVAVAQVYLRHRPIADVAELRIVTAAVARMPASDAQVHALDTLAQQRLSDKESLDAIARLYPVARSVNVQRAIAGVLIRSDYEMLARADLARELRQYRLKSGDGDDVIGALIRRLQSP